MSHADSHDASSSGTTIRSGVRTRRRRVTRLHACRFLADTRGAIAILAALSLLSVVAAAAVALDLANLYLAQSSAQRIADQSALAGAFAYVQSSKNATTAQHAASSLATANGAGSASVVATIVSSPTGDGNKAVEVVVTSTVELGPFGRAIANTGVVSYNVSATAYAEMRSNSPTPCIIALGSSGMSATGGSSITGTDCEIWSDGSITATDGSHITAGQIYAVGTASAPDNDGSTVTTSPTAGQIHNAAAAPSDPFAATNVFSRMASVAALTETGPSLGTAPSGGSAIACISGTLSVPAGTYSTIIVGSGCTGVTFAGGTTNVSGYLSLSNTAAPVTFNAGTYNIANITVSSSGAESAKFTMSGTVVFNIWSGLNVTGSATLTVSGPATYNVEGGINVETNGSMSITNGSGSSTSTFWVAGGIDIGQGNATFPAGRYTIGNTSGYGLYVDSDCVVTFGDGSFIISGQTGGIVVEASGKLTIGSALDGSSVFQITGIEYAYDDAIYTDGSSTLTLGSFTNFDINGAVSLDSSVTFGAGTYTVNGAFNACSSGGTLSGTGASVLASGAICFGSGFSSISFSAPASITSANVGSASTIALASSSTSAAAITSGASDTVVDGAVYLPNAALTFSGSGKLTDGGDCLQVISKSLTITNDPNGVTAACSALGDSPSSSTSVLLVQ